MRIASSLIGAIVAVAPAAGAQGWGRVQIGLGAGTVSAGFGLGTGVTPVVRQPGEAGSGRAGSAGTGATGTVGVGDGVLATPLRRFQPVPLSHVQVWPDPYSTSCPCLASYAATGSGTAGCLAAGSRVHF